MPAAPANEAGGREEEASPPNVQPPAVIPEPPQHGYGTRSSGRLFSIPEGTTMSDSASHELQKLETQMNLALFKVAKEFDNDFEKAMIAVIESGLTGATSSGYAEPKTVSEARNQTDWKLWEATITKEHNSMLEKKVWTPRKLEEVPKNCRILGSKWVFKLKEGPLHRATLISQGFNQIPGVDFTDAYAPVVQDITLRMLLTLNDCSEHEG